MKKMVNAKLRESLDAEFCQRALNAVRVAALRDGKSNEQILVHLTLSRGEGFLAFLIKKIASRK